MATRSPDIATPCTLSAPGPPRRISQARPPLAVRRATKPSVLPPLPTARSAMRRVPVNDPPTRTPSGAAASAPITDQSVASIASFQATAPVAASSAPSAATTLLPDTASGPPNPSSSTRQATASGGSMRRASIATRAGRFTTAAEPDDELGAPPEEPDAATWVRAANIIEGVAATPVSMAPSRPISTVCGAIAAALGPRGEGQAASEQASQQMRRIRAGASGRMSRRDLKSDLLAAGAQLGDHRGQPELVDAAHAARRQLERDPALLILEPESLDPDVDL